MPLLWFKTQKYHAQQIWRLLVVKSQMKSDVKSDSIYNVGLNVTHHTDHADCEGILFFTSDNPWKNAKFDSNSKIGCKNMFSWSDFTVTIIRLVWIQSGALHVCVKADVILASLAVPANHKSRNWFLADISVCVNG